MHLLRRCLSLYRSLAGGGGRASPVRLYGCDFDFGEFGDNPAIVRQTSLHTYEQREARFARRAVRPGDRVLELGGGLGVVSTIAAKSVDGGTLTVVEADGRLLPIIEGNLKLNGVTATLLHGAAFARDRLPETAEVDFFLLPLFTGSSLTEPKARKILRKVSVPVLCLEDLLAQYDINVLLMDIEGAELDLLTWGALTGIRDIVCEFHQPLDDDRRRRAMERLAEMGFASRTTSGKGQVVWMGRSD